MGKKSIRTVLTAEAPSLEDHLVKHLPEEGSAKIAAVGWGEAELGPLARPDLVVFVSLDALEGVSERFDLVFWHFSGAEGEAQRGLELLRGLLEDEATLVIAGRLEAAYDELPPREEVVFRDLVRRISEARLAVIEDRNLSVEGLDGCWRVMLARPDAMEIRSYRPGDEAEILRLFKPCFHAEQSLEHWRWKYVENPWGQTVISVALSPEGELTAHYAGYPTPFWIGDRRENRTFAAIQLGDIMTNPEYRDRGRRRSSLLARTVRHYFAARRDGKYGYYYGFPIRLHQRFCEWFIGARHLEPAPLWVREPASGESSKELGTRVERFESPPEAADRLFRRVAPEYGFLMHRTASYLDWRYFRRPGVEYVMLGVYRWLRLVGWAIFRRDGERLIWGDVLVEPKHAERASRALLEAALEQGEFQGIERIEGWFSDRPAWWNDVLPKLGFERRDDSNQLAFIYFPDGEPDADDTLEELYYTMGDIDLF